MNRVRIDRYTKGTLRTLSSKLLAYILDGHILQEVVEVLSIQLQLLINYDSGCHRISKEELSKFCFGLTFRVGLNIQGGLKLESNSYNYVKSASFHENFFFMALTFDCSIKHLYNFRIRNNWYPSIFPVQGKDEFLGRCHCKPVVKLPGVKAPAVQLMWYTITRGEREAGEVLAAFELFLVIFLSIFFTFL